MPLTFADLPPLEVKCEACSGEGFSTHPHADGRDRRHPCSQCDMRGYVPSEFGEAVLDLVRKYVKVSGGNLA